LSTPDHADILDNPQTGARDIAKTMFGMVREVREQMVVKFQKDRIDLGPDAVFRSVFAGGEQPGDHLLPYAHILRGCAGSCRSTSSTYSTAATCRASMRPTSPAWPSSASSRTRGPGGNPFLDPFAALSLNPPVN
jgi:hypothetical protein